MKKYPIVVKGIELFFEVYLIGYKNNGESIVLFIKDQFEKSLWCGVIDCYTYKNHNKTKRLLEDYGYGEDRKIDFICISHPDLDHIKSMSNIINQFTNEETMFVLPNFTDSNIIQTKEIMKIKESLKKILSNSYTRTKVINNIFFNQKIGITDLRWEFIVGTRKINMQIESLTPFDSIMLNSKNVNYQQFKNDFSVCLKITLNDFKYIFMGDCTDLVLRELDEYYIPEQINYLKIPHHGCKNEIMEYYVNNVINELDVTGCAYRKNTTLKSTLDFYKENSAIVSITGDILHEKNIMPYGYLRHVYNAITGELIEDKCESEGNAILMY